ncbi:DMT family transporter [Poseidonibacter sp.]|uniref:DMT family transporter n=1 Tax=Poseidonibacter sp. TaxID=2321188 RepID=UPI003C7297F0
METSNLKAHLFVFLATFLVAGSFLASHNLATIVNPFSLTLLRFVISFILLAPFILLQSSRRSEIIPMLPRAMVISFFYSGYFLAMFEALKTTTVLNTGTLYTLVPLLTAIFAFFIFKEKISFNKFIVYLIGVFGTIWVIFKADIQLLLEFSLNSGDYIYIIGAVSMCFYSISLKLVHKKSDNSLNMVFATLIGGMFWMSLFMLFFNEPLNWTLIQGDLVYSMLYLAIITTLLTLYLYQKATAILGPTRVMSYVYLNPIAVVLLLFVVQNIAIETIIIPGILISCIATFFLQRNSKAIKRE